MKTQRPKNPQKAGRELWTWINENCEGIENALPLVHEMCFVCDHLADARERLSQASEPRERKALLDLTVKLSGQFLKLWRGLGLAKEQAPERRPVGRPPLSESRR